MRDLLALSETTTRGAQVLLIATTAM